MVGSAARALRCRGTNNLDLIEYEIVPVDDLLGRPRDQLLDLSGLHALDLAKLRGRVVHQSLADRSAVVPRGGHLDGVARLKLPKLVDHSHGQQARPALAKRGLRAIIDHNAPARRSRVPQPQLEA